MTNRTCSVDGCDKGYHSAGYCKLHYSRWRRHGDPLVTLFKAAAPSGNGPCHVDGCEKPHAAKGICPMHYQRMRLYGSFDSPMPDIEQRLLAKTRKTETCWLWEGALSARGWYGQMHVMIDGKRRLQQAHRIAYETWVGPIPDGLFIDHICHVPQCVNPDHLRPVTQKENLEHRSGAARHSKTGIRGVSPSNGKWRGALTHNKKHVTVGRYATIEEAAEAVKAKRLELFTHNDLDRR